MKRPDRLWNHPYVNGKFDHGYTTHCRVYTMPVTPGRVPPSTHTVQSRDNTMSSVGFKVPPAMPASCRLLVLA